jgi:hypothetical protein
MRSILERGLNFAASIDDEAPTEKLLDLDVMDAVYNLSSLSFSVFKGKIILKVNE